LADGQGGDNVWNCRAGVESVAGPAISGVLLDVRKSASANVDHLDFLDKGDTNHAREAQ
jgi:hypothetical protein